METIETKLEALELKPEVKQPVKLIEIHKEQTQKEQKMDIQKEQAQKEQKPLEKREEKKEPSQEKTDESDMTGTYQILFMCSAFHLMRWRH